MAITVIAYANADDVLIVWQPDAWSNDWVGFQLERRDESNQQVTVVANRIPPQPGQGPVAQAGISSTLSPIRRCIWTDHNAVTTDNVSYRVTAVKNAPNGQFVLDTASASQWTPPLVTTGDAGGGLEAYFNRGTLMSQVVSRFVDGNVTPPSLRKFLNSLEDPNFPARRYLSGDALHEILTFLGEADRRGSAIYAAIYEMNDEQLVDALKPFGDRGHVLLGNGGATQPWVAQQLTAAGLEVRHRDLSHSGRSSPSVHNKFVVECDKLGRNASRVLTGSTNWTTTGLCTQLNNVLIIQDAVIAARYRDQWNKLVASGDDMTPALKQSNSQPTINNGTTLFFAATNGEVEFKPILDLIAGAKHGLLFLMFMPGDSPLLEALLDRAQQNQIYVRGVVSRVTTSANSNIATAGGQVIKSGAPAQDFYHDINLPVGVPEKDKPSWAEVEFNTQEIYAAHLMAIVHSKTIVVDPFSDNCAVITGSHNFSLNASKNNDENLVIVRGNKKLAQVYALHINGVYDHYSWRSFLGSGGDPDQIYKSLDGWKPGGARTQEIAFWMDQPMPPRQSTPGMAAEPNAPDRVKVGLKKKSVRTKKAVPKKSASKKSAPKKSAPKKGTKNPSPKNGKAK